MIRLRSEDLFWRAGDDEVIALDVRTSGYYAANSSGAALWSRLEDGASEAQLVETLCERYGVPREVAEADVAAFLEQLSASGMLDRDGA